MAEDIGREESPREASVVGTCPRVEVEASGVKLSCMLDTGSQVTMFSDSFFQKWLGHLPIQEPSSVSWLTLKAANGLNIPYIGYAVVDFIVGGLQVPGKGVVIVKDECLGADQGILGMNVITHCWRELFQGVSQGLTGFNSTLSGEARREWQKAFAVCRRVIQTHETEGMIGTARLGKGDQNRIPATCEKLLWARVVGCGPSKDYLGLVEDVGEGAEWQVARTVVRVQDGRFPLRLLNLQPYPLELPRRRPLATVTPLDPTQVCGEKDLILREQRPGEVEVDVQTVQLKPKGQPPVDLPPVEGLTSEQQHKLEALLSHWTDVFAAHEEDYGQTDAVLHHIPTGTAPPSRERYRPVPPALYQELRQLLSGMLSSDVITESSSPWAAPIVLVKKKDGTWRFCVDYRRLNAVTHKDAFPLPRIEESLTSLKGAAWYSTLDLASGYWQVRVNPEDKEKTAFTTPIGLFEFSRMPFGLCNAPATFQRLMQKCLGDKVNDFLLIYLDDVIVYSPDFDCHLQHLEQVFQRLAKYGLKLQPQKCKFLQKEVIYLGHVVSEVGVSTDPGKIDVVRDWAQPETTTHVRSFLGFAGYYRRFIPSFSRIAAPLHGLLTGTAALGKKGKPVVWTPACQQAFEHLKTALLTAPILAYADFTKPFLLYTDASFEGLGAVLSQVQEGKERVIAYASRSLSPSERNDKHYSSFKLELLALKWAVTDKFRDYLWGAEVTVYTDNNPLVHLDTAKLGAVEQRWVAQLASFQLEVKYRPGRSNQNADLLSRLPRTKGQVCLAQEVRPEEFQPEPAPEGGINWRQVQQEDPALQVLSERLYRGERPTGRARQDAYQEERRWWREWDRLALKDGIIGRKVWIAVESTWGWQILVPGSATQGLWGSYHASLGHLSAGRIEAALRRGFYWPRLGEDVRRWTAECPQCVQRKPGPEVKAPLAPITTSYPLETVAIDYLSLGRPGDTYPYLLVMTDLFSRYGWAVPTKDQTAETTVRALWTAVVQHWGCPEQILSDQGAAFESELVAQFCQLYGCRKVRTTPYRPQGNGACERFNQSLLSLLGSLEEDRQRRWPEHLPMLLQAYNNTQHSSTGLTPFFVMCGRHARLPVDVITGVDIPRPRMDLDGWVQYHYDQLRRGYNQVKARTQHQQERDKQRYDKRAKDIPLIEGERVLLRNFRRRGQGKLAPHWQPKPFVVLGPLRPGLPVLRIRPEGGGPERTIHRNHLRPCPYTVPQDVPAEASPDPRQPGELPQQVPGPSWRNYTWYPVHVPLAPPVAIPATPPRGQGAGIEVESPAREEGGLRRSHRENRRPPVRYQS